MGRNGEDSFGLVVVDQLAADLAIDTEMFQRRLDQSSAEVSEGPS